MPLMATATPTGAVSTTGIPSSMIDWLFPHFERRTINRRSVNDDVGLDNVGSSMPDNSSSFTGIASQLEA